MRARKTAKGRSPGRPCLTAEEIAGERSRIASLAATLFHEEGYGSVSMRRVAAEAGCAPMTLYAYFSSKADILAQIWGRFFVELFADLNRTARRIPDPVRRVKAVSRRYVDYWLTHPERYRMVFMTEGVTQPEVGAFIGESEVPAHYALFANMLRDAGVEEARQKIMSETLICAINGIAHSHITMSDYRWEPAERLVDAITSAILSS